MFHEVISTSVQVLVKGLETACEPALASLVKIKWDGIEEVGDTSPFVSQVFCLLLCCQLILCIRLEDT